MPSAKPLLTLRARQLRRQATDAETRLWQQLRNRQLVGAKFRRQVPVGGYILDFYCLEAKLGIELDGGQHLQQEAYDHKRTEDLAGLGIRVLRFWNDAVLTEIEAVVRVILEELDQRRGKPRLISPVSGWKSPLTPTRLPVGEGVFPIPSVPSLGQPSPLLCAVIFS